MKDDLALMFEEIRLAKKVVRPSKYWEQLNKTAMKNLRRTGYQNFKQTLALHYFTWIVKPNDTKLSTLNSSLPFTTKMKVWSKIIKKHDVLPWTFSLAYNLTTGFLWEYAKYNYPKTCSALEEPEEGNPPKMYDRGRLISQDLAHSIIEYQSVMEGMRSKPKTVIELGGGYGRNAYVFLKLNPGIKYIMVDIPPALWVAQKYLSTVFPDLTIFKFRHFENFNEIQEEFESSDIVILTSNQLEMLPDKIADLFINISSLHEMRMDQITYYLKQIDRVTKGFFYFKQWKWSKIPFENVIIRENEYPIPRKWKRLYHRDCLFPSNFFEAMYAINNANAKRPKP